VSRPGVCGGPPTSLSLRSWTNRAAKRIEVDLDRVHLTGTGMCVRFDASNWRWSDAPLVRWLGSPRAAIVRLPPWQGAPPGGRAGEGGRL
jgi:hypothetical protein